MLAIIESTDKLRKQRALPKNGAVYPASYKLDPGLTIVAATSRLTSRACRPSRAKRAPSPEDPLPAGYEEAALGSKVGDRSQLASSLALYCLDELFVERWILAEHLRYLVCEAVQQRRVEP